jgi:hypothetical protein
MRSHISKSHCLNPGESLAIGRAVKNGQPNFVFAVANVPNNDSTTSTLNTTKRHRELNMQQLVSAPGW